MSVTFVGTEEHPAWRYKAGVWTVEVSSLLGVDVPSGYMQRIFEKDGVYACPPFSSYDTPFAADCGWREVVSYPSHGDVVEGPEFDNQKWLKEFDTWWAAVDKIDDNGASEELLGTQTLEKLAQPDYLREAAQIARHLSIVMENGHTPKTALPLFTVWKSVQQGRLTPERGVILIDWRARTMRSAAAREAAPLIQAKILSLEWDVLTAAWEWAQGQGFEAYL